MTNDVYLKMAYEKFSIPIIKETASESMMDAYLRMCQDHKFTYVHLEFPDSLIHRLEEMGFCRVKKIPGSIYPIWMAMQLRHGSPD